MATQTYFSLKGLEEYLEKISAAGQDIDEAAAIAILEGCEVMKEGMQRRVAKDTHNLEQHIQIDGPHQEGNYIFAEVGVIHKKEFTDAETARYGNAQEYGTSSMSAQPYIRPTIKGDKTKALREMKKSLEEAGAI
jgi:HK97 gp10 family phage protein